MARPVMFDTDMGVDDAVALTLASCAESLTVAGITTVGGNVSAEQAARNAGRCLGGLSLAAMPPVARGLDQDAADLPDANAIFGSDGLGNSEIAVPAGWSPDEGLGLYERLIAAFPGKLTVVAIGPLTNLAALMERRPSLLADVERIVIMGGALFCPGNVTPRAEFNIYRDPAAAARVLASGLPLTLVPLDVTRKVAFDESSRARLAASGTCGGQMLARMLEYPMAQGIDGPPGRFLVHDALAVGTLIWPELFLHTQMAVNVVLDGPDRGRTVPVVGKKNLPRISAVLSVQVADLIENMLELLCSEEFVV